MGLLTHQRLQADASLIQVMNDAGDAGSNNGFVRFSPIAQGAPLKYFAVGFQGKGNGKRIVRGFDGIDFASDGCGMEVQRRQRRHGGEWKTRGLVIGMARTGRKVPDETKIHGHYGQALGIHITHMHDVASGDNGAYLIGINDFHGRPVAYDGDAPLQCARYCAVLIDAPAYPLPPPDQTLPYTTYDATPQYHKDEQTADP